MLFVAVTAVLNIGLGYGLAIHLGHAPWPKLHRRAKGSAAAVEVGLESPRDVSIDEFSPDSLPTAAAIPVGLASQTSTEPGPVVTAPVTGPGTSSGDSADLEHEVLAGIEEFRNQLAQMKAQPGAPMELADEPAAAAAHA